MYFIQNVKSRSSLNKLDYVFQQLKQRIASGFWKIGENLPSEAELAAEFGCGAGTVNKAVGRLAYDGLVERRTKIGTRVIRHFDSATDTPPLQLDACAFIYPNDQHEGIWRIMRGFQQAAYEAERRVLTLATGTDIRKEAEIIGRLTEFDVKGTAIYPVFPDPLDQVLFAQTLLTSKFPVVLVELNIPGLRLPAVVADGIHAGYISTRHLLDQGLRRIGFISNYSWAPFVRDRYMGYRQALEEAGVSEQVDIVLLDPSMHPSFEDPLQEPTNLAKGYLTAHRNDIDGVVCTSDFLAHGCLLAAKDLSIDVPGKIKIVGIDDFHTLPYSDQLTTYHIPYEEIGRQAFKTLDAQLKTSTHSFGEQQLRGHLVKRKSA